MNRSWTKYVRLICTLLSHRTGLLQIVLSSILCFGSRTLCACIVIIWNKTSYYSSIPWQWTSCLPASAPPLPHEDSALHKPQPPRVGHPLHHLWLRIRVKLPLTQLVVLEARCDLRWTSPVLIVMSGPGAWRMLVPGKERKKTAGLY